MQVQVTDRATSRPLRLVLAGLIVVATILFVIGVAVERGSEAREAPGLHQETGEASETPGEADEQADAPATVAGPVESAARSETVLGLDLENPGVVAAIVVGWLVLLGALFVFGRGALVVIALAALAATLLDLNEVLLQIDRGNTLVATLAVAVTIAHAALCFVAGWALLRGRERIVAHSA